jgi:hypothetical protein
MACCGGKRQQLRSPAQPSRSGLRMRTTPVGANLPSAQPGPTATSSTPVYFKYVGKTGLTVDSPITGKRYRFDQPGAQLAADARDQSLLTYVPNLVPVRQAK